ncbi:MAG: ABC transporter permease [Phycisphaerae bacterium]|nr:ABC transporter permease [Phycisphaerae bacterium]
MTTLWQDLKYAVRMLAHTPGFTVVAVLTFALGIGASTAIFSGVNALWFNPVPAAEPDRLVQIRAFNKEKNDYAQGVSPVILEELRAQRDYFADLTRMKDWGVLSWEDEGWIEEIYGARVSPNFFSFWNARPRLGRTFAADEGRPDGSPVIVLSHEFWKNKLGGDPGWVGKSLRIQSQYYTVIGVMPPHFRYPYFVDFWFPADDPEVTPADKDPQGLRFRSNNGVIARLALGVSMKQAQAILDVLARRYEEEHRTQGYGYTLLHARPVREIFASADVQKTVPGFVGAMIFVLLIACANVANLNLARAEARQHEFAIRGALGAGRFRLLRQLLLESLLLALAGAVAGMALTYWSFGLMERLLPFQLPRLRAVELDWQVLGYSLLVAVTAGLISGTIPAWYGATGPVANVLKQTGVQATPGLLRNLYRRGLVVLEVSLAMVLLTGAGLMIQSVVHLLRTNLGFEPTNLVAIQTNPASDSKKYRTVEAKNLLVSEIHRRLNAVPGVEAVGILVNGQGERKFALTGQQEPVESYWLASGVGSSDAFKAMRMPLLHGRYFDEQDLGSNATAVLVNETLARRCWPGENAVGKTIRLRDVDDNSTHEVVGVVADTRWPWWLLARPILPTVYQPQQVGYINRGYIFFVRTRTQPDGLIKALLAEVKAAGPDLHKPVAVLPKNEFYDSTRAHRTYMCYLAVFGAVGLLLAGVGVYAVLAYSVALRQREIGIRMALGAAAPGVVRMMLRQGMTLVGIGIGLGLGAACALTRVLRGMLYGVSPMDPLTLAAGALLLSLIALVACYLPARRAARIDPMVALRYE